MAKGFDLSKFSDDELLALNHQIIATLKSRSAQTKDEQFAGITPGQRLSFLGPEGNPIIGTVLRINKNSVTIATEHGTWRIDPGFIQREKVTGSATGKVLRMHPHKK